MLFAKFPLLCGVVKQFVVHANSQQGTIVIHSDNYKSFIVYISYAS